MAVVLDMLLLASVAVVLVMLVSPPDPESEADTVRWKFGTWGLVSITACQLVPMFYLHVQLLVKTGFKVNDKEGIKGREYDYMYMYICKGGFL